MNVDLLAAARSDARSLVALAKIEVSSPSVLTLYVGESEVLTPDGQLWEGGLKADPVRMEVDALGTGPAPASLTIWIESRRYSFQSASETIGDALHSYQWQGARVTLYLWDRSLASFATPSEFQRFSGTVDGLGLDDGALRLDCLQDRSWNRPVPTVSVDTTNYPNAPDGQQGAVIPIVYGSHIAPPLRSPHTAAYTNKSYHEDSGAGAGAIPLVLVDPGTGANKVKLVAASHAMGDLIDRANGYTAFMVANDVLAPLDTAGITETLTGPSYLTIDDDTLIAYYGVRATDVRTVGAGTVNSALNPRRASDVFDETSYATLNQTAGTDQEKIVLIGPNIGALGNIEAVTVIMCFSGDAANTQNIRVYPECMADALAGAVISTVSTGTTPQIVTGTWDAAYYNKNTWQFGTKTASGNSDEWSVDFAGASANNKARIYWLALRVKYRPSRNLITPGVTKPGYVSVNTRGGKGPGGGLGIRYTPEQEIAAPSYSLSGQFYSHAKGYVDDGGGTYTGSAAATIERPCDMARHFLTTYGGASSFETGATAFGSFVLARDLLRNASPSDFKLAAWMGEASSVQRYLQKMCEQSLMCVVQDTFTDKWLCHVWKQGAAVDYDLTFTRNELPDMFEPSLTSSITLAQGVRVRYGYDYFRSRTQYECYVGASGSSQGYNLPTVADQSLVVTAGVNNALDYYDHNGAATYATTLTPGTYTPIDLAAEIQSKMRAHLTHQRVNHGFTVKTGFNDKLDFHIGATTYTGTLREGVYNADSIATEAAYALTNAPGGHGKTFTVAYAQSTNKHTLTTSSGTFAVYLASGPNKLTEGWSVIGFYGDIVAASSQTGSAIYADRFVFYGISHGGGPDPFILKWLSGAGSATNCAYLVGMPRTADTTDAAYQLCTYARGQRETTCAASQTAYGPRADSIITADWIKDEASAQQRRDREFDFGSAPRVRLIAKTHFAPDLQVMRVIGIGADMDARRAYPKYGSDGSWAGKPMRVLSVLHHNGPSYHTEFIAEEA